MRTRVFARVLSGVLAGALLAGCGADDGRRGDSSPPSSTPPSPEEGDVVSVEGVPHRPDEAALAPDGARIAVPCRDDLCVWDTASGKLAATLPGGRLVAWSANDLVATTQTGSRARVLMLDPSGGDVVATLDSHGVDPVEDELGGGILALAFSPDGSLLAASGDDGEVRLWPMEQVTDGEAEPVGSLAPGGDRVDVLAFSPDGALLAVASPDRPVEIWDVTARTLRGTLDAEPQGDVAWSPDGHTLATATRAPGPEATVRLWSTRDLSEDGRLPVPVGGESGQGESGQADKLAFSPDGSLLATSRKDAPAVLLWDLRTDVRSVVLDEVVRAVLWSPDGAQVYAVGAREGVVAVDVAGGDVARRFEAAPVS